MLENLTSLSQDISEFCKTNPSRKIVLVHGGAAKTTEVAEKLGIQQKFVESTSGFKSRFTDARTLEVFTMVTCGLVNKQIVASLQRAGVNAVGLSGADGRVLEAKRKDVLRIVENGKEKILRGDFTGKVEKVNYELLNLLIEGGVVPVIAPVAISSENELVTTDADRNAAAIASALNAEKLVLLTDVDGFYENYSASANAMESALVSRIASESQLNNAIEKASGGMKKKLLAAREALANGVRKVIISNGLKEMIL